MLPAMGNNWKVLKYDTCFQFSDHSVVICEEDVIQKHKRQGKPLEDYLSR